MANETLSTSVAGAIATEKMSQLAIAANLPKMVISQDGFCHYDDSLMGANSGTKRYTVNADLGAASAGTQGTAVTNSIEITTATNITATPAEGVVDVFEITHIAIMQALGIRHDEVARIIGGGGSQAEYERLLGPFISRLIPRGMQKIEADGLAQLANASTSVGSSGNDITMLNLLQAIYERRKSQGHRPMSECRFLLTENQKHEVDLEMLSTTGGVAGSMWLQQANYGVGRDIQATSTQNGLVGSFLQYPVYTYDSELNVTANAAADVVGAFGSFGDNRAPDDPSLQGQCGALVRVVVQPLSFQFLPSIGMRSITGNMVANYIWKEVSDKDYIKIVTDAP